jgi:hypothetical protein
LEADQGSRPAQAKSCSDPHLNQQAGLDGAYYNPRYMRIVDRRIMVRSWHIILYPNNKSKNGPRA